MSKKWDLNASEYWNHTWSSNDTQHYWDSDINITYVNYYLHQPQVAAIFISSYFLIFFLCMVGNTVVCFIVIRNKHMHTVTNFFILNLAISDLLVGIFCMPITLLDNIIAGMLSYVWYKDDVRKYRQTFLSQSAQSEEHETLNLRIMSSSHVGCHL